MLALHICLVGEVVFHVIILYDLRHIIPDSPVFTVGCAVVLAPLIFLNLLWSPILLLNQCSVIAEFGDVT